MQRELAQYVRKKDNVEVELVSTFQLVDNTIIFADSSNRFGSNRIKQWEDIEKVQ